MSARFGIGYDIHALVKGRPLLLGGVRIPSPTGLAGHSDADVLLHAMVDAVLGAMGQPDIGELFPDTDPRHAGADSRRFVELTRKLMARGRWRLTNLDATIIAERPKLGAHKERIRASVAALWGVPEELVSVKAKTNERFDALGSGRAMACLAVAGVERGRST